MSDQTTPPAPHPHEIVHDEALRLMMRLDGKDPRPETAVVAEWIMSHRWYQVKTPELATAVWIDLSNQGDGSNVTAAVDLIVELTMRVIAQLRYYGIYDAALEAFLYGQQAFQRSQSIHEHLLEKLPYVQANTVSGGVIRTPQHSALAPRSTTQATDYAEFIRQEPWIFICHLLLRCGVLQTLSTRSTDRPATTKRAETRAAS